MEASFVNFISSDKSYMGFVSLPNEFEDPEYKLSEEGKTILAEKEAQGINAYCAHLREVVRNETEGMARDLQMKNIQADVRTMLSDGATEALKKLAEYKRQNKDAGQARLDEAEKLLKEIELD
jgi:hypothetical protein